MDMDQIPNPIEVMNFNNSKFGGGEVFETNEAGKMPPLITTDFICKDKICKYFVCIGDRYFWNISDIKNI